MQVPEPACITCGLPLAVPGVCPTCNNSTPPYMAIRSWAVFEGPIRHALHTLKYYRNVALGDALAPYLVKYVQGLGWQADLVVPVPSSSKRMKERGYNQVGLFARPTAGILGWRYVPSALRRVRETRSQVGLSHMERKVNIFSAFQANPVHAYGKVILLMDDIVTSGATLTACSEALMEAGAKGVFALTLARALPYHGLQIV
jgi:ComF family protein